jgi:DNA-binding NarL/FixJ family response regulator
MAGCCHVARKRALANVIDIIPGSIRVLIADDDERVRRGFAGLLELEHDMEVVGLANDGEIVLDLAQRLRPDVVIMDIRMPRLDGIAATRKLREGNPPWGRTLVVTTFDLDEYVLGAARAGASGFLLKDDAPEELAKAVRVVASGDAIVSPRATARLLQEFVQPADSSSRGGAANRTRSSRCSSHGTRVEQ